MWVKKISELKFTCWFCWWQSERKNNIKSKKFTLKKEWLNYYLISKLTVDWEQWEANNFNKSMESKKKLNLLQNCWQILFFFADFFFWVCCNLCSSEEEEFLAEFLEKILLENFFSFFNLLQFLQFRRRGICCTIVAQNFVADFFCYFEFVAFLAVQKKRNLLQNFSVVLSVLQQSFFAGCRIFVLFWSVKVQQSLLHFQEKRLCCRILCCFEVCCSEKNYSSVEVNFFVVFGACCSNHFAVQ